LGESRIKIYLIIILAVAFAVRLAATLSIGRPQEVPRTADESDAPTYYVIADNILSGNGYTYGKDLPPTAKRTPGYPLFIASVFKIFGRDFNGIRHAQAAMDVLTAYLVFILAALVFERKTVGLLASLAYALYPPSILSSTYILTETLYTFFLALFAVAAILALKTRRYPFYLVSGIVLGLSSLTRPGILLLPLVLLIIALIARRRAWKGFVIVALAFAVTLLPWTLRNKRDLGKAIPTSTFVGGNLYMGNHLSTGGAYPMSSDSLFADDLRLKLSGTTEVRRDSILRAEAIRIILANKKEVALLTVKKIPRLWLNLGYGRSPSKKSLGVAATHCLFIALGIYGFLAIPSYIKYLAFVQITTIVFSSIMYLTITSVVRFVFPLIPLLLPFSAMGFLSLVDKLRLAR
jgi:4-amino-4-deoxy-L-arabinose transferase-like glycosyltransferase